MENHGREDDISRAMRLKQDTPTQAYDPNTRTWAATQGLGPTPSVKLRTALPTTDAERKALPVFTGVVMYFPKALLEVARVSKLGNDQHNPGEPLHWAREKSTDQMNTAMRHQMDHGTGNTRDTDGSYHLAKAIWRLCAELELTIEKDGGQ